MIEYNGKQHRDEIDLEGYYEFLRGHPKPYQTQAELECKGWEEGRDVYSAWRMERRLYLLFNFEWINIPDPIGDYYRELKKRDSWQLSPIGRLEMANFPCAYRFY